MSLPQRQSRECNDFHTATKVISVPLRGDLRRFLKDEARRQDRTMAGQSRHLLAESRRARSNSVSEIGSE
jgi:hypothetical protein